MRGGKIELPAINSKHAEVILHPSTFNVVSFCKPETREMVEYPGNVENRIT